ncbi:TLR adapter interacting with SLC15A4 on the lysosome-like [Elgaria multicarinata webbii]|uniref:TLR adapter interacting with SLC15A4 on the lysosome-like n=1 Tax=Elgaria multicarinata webbii TaxID=159646 RepID=UPI002FCD5FF8
MLAESFLAQLAYRDEEYELHLCQGLKPVGGDSWEDHLIDTDEHQGFHPESKKQAAVNMVATCYDMGMDREAHQRNSVPKPPMKEGNDIPPSAPVRIPRREQYCEEELDLYRSWSCQSLYQNYPDLHIGGDHIADHTCDSGCIMDQTYDERSAGPVLLSKDIRLGHSPISEPQQNSKDTKFSHGEEAGERSMTLHKEPLSNSMINNYMEKKVQELYNQFLEEKLTQCSSINHLLMSNLLMNNIGEVHRQLSHDRHIDASKATQTLLHSLALFGLQNTSNGNSSEFSTPNLQISTPHGRRQPSGVWYAS